MRSMLAAIALFTLMIPRAAPPSCAQSPAASTAHAPWRSATPQELADVLPARAPVLRERIETEASSNTGITDGHGHTFAATVLITAGYAAHGKYSHFVITQAPLTLGDHLLVEPGDYLIGWTREAEGLNVHLYQADTGAEVGSVIALPSNPPLTVVSVRIWPPSAHAVLQIGRFVIPYRLR